MRMAVLVLGLALLAPTAGLAQAGAQEVTEAGAEPAVVRVTLKDHRFIPDTVVAPAGRPLRIELANEGSALEAFDCPAFGMTADLSPHGHASLAVGPLKPGRYELHAGAGLGVLEVASP